MAGSKAPSEGRKTVLRKQFALASLLLILMGAFATTDAVWLEDGTPVCLSAGDQRYPWIVEDGAGGAFMAWEDIDFEAIYAARIDSAGVTMWGWGGVPVSTAPGEKLRPVLVRDGVDGIIICWYEKRNGVDYDAYVQRLNASGNALWTADGVALCTAAGNQERTLIVPDGSGGAIVTWYDSRSGDWDIYAQRVDSGGNMLWTGDGVCVCCESGDQEWGKIATDHAGGAVIAWHDSRGGDYDIYAQRIDADGNSLWTPNGALLCGETRDQVCRAIVDDGVGGAIAVWEDDRDNELDIYTRRIDASGTPLWAPDGVPICTARYDQSWANACSDEAGGAIIAWCDNRDPKQDLDAFVQRIDGDGNILWPVDGVLLRVGQYDQQNVHVISDGDGGAICTWRDGLNSTNIAAQRIRSDGSPYYITQVVFPCNADFTQTLGHLVPDGNGGAIIVWYDHRDIDYDIYAYRLSFEGGPYPPEILSIDDVPGDEGGWLTIEWLSSVIDTLPDNPVDHYSVWHWRTEPAVLNINSTDLISAPSEIPSGESNYNVPDPVAPSGPEHIALQSELAEASYAWRLIGTVGADGSSSYMFTAESLHDSIASDTGWQKFIIVTHHQDDAIIYESVVDSGYSVDNLPPAAPQNLTATQQVVPDGLELTWQANTEPDLSHYELYRGTDPDFIPDSESFLDDYTETIAFDPEWRWDSCYWFKVFAMDTHGNMSPHSMIGPDQVTGTETETPLTWHLAQNTPNPFNPITNIQFTLAEAGEVNLSIYSASGYLVRNLIKEHREANVYSFLWDGRDDGGAQVASGVYFCKLTSGTFSQTRKMVFLK
jgi:hypothetical protein